MAVALLHSSAQWFTLILRGIPIHLEILMFLLLVRVQLFIHLVDYFLVGSTLERDHLTLVVEA